MEYEPRVLFRLRPEVLLRLREEQTDLTRRLLKVNRKHMMRSTDRWQG